MTHDLAPTESMPPHGATRTVLSALASWWTRSREAPDEEMTLGYESAHPWGMDGADPADAGATR